MKIYTKKGDQGNTSLITGERVKKSSARIHASGNVDELNAHIGLLISYLPETCDAKENLSAIQKRLFAIGSHLSCESDPQFKMPSLEQSWVEDLESQIDKMEEVTTPLKNFILPGGSKQGALSHICRTICRRAERLCVEIDCSELIIKYLNRLSDYFFVLARYVNHKNKIKDTIWHGD